MATEALSVSDLHAYYGDSHVLYGVSFALEESRVLALLGRNGAGKTTCISSIMGLLPPRGGEIRLFGEKISGLPPEAISRLGVGLVPQGRRIFPTLSVRENLVVAAQRQNGAGKAPGKTWTLDRIYDLFPRMQERQNQLAGSLSGGEQQMLAIGRALMGNPKVLLLDEPSEGLAPLIVQEVGRTIQRLKDEGQSIILVEQNSRMALEVADQVVILNTGETAFSGSADEVRADEDLVTRNLGIFHGH